MKKLNLLIGTVLLALISTLGYAQAPESFNYQAVLRDAGGSIIANQTVEMRFSVRTGNANGLHQYREEQVLTTNEFGLVDHAIGTGTPFLGEFDDITWGDDAKFLRVDLDNGDGYVTIGTQQLVSVPYALNAKTAETLSGGLPFSGWNSSGNNISNSNSGNVGIGTATPTSKLSVAGSADISGKLGIGVQGPIASSFFIEAISDVDKAFRLFNFPGALTAGFSNSGSLDGCLLRLNGIEGDGFWDLGQTDENDFRIARGPGGLNSTFIIKESGNIGIGTLNPNYRLEVNGSAGKPGGGSWSAASDIRLKQDIEPYADGLSAIMAIRPVTYRYNEKSGIDTEKEYVGVIAQELREVAPEMVGTFERDGTTYLDVDNSAMTYMLINAVKEQQAQIEAQQEQIDALIEEIESLKNK